MGIGGFMSVIGTNLKEKHDREYKEQKQARDTEIDIYTKIIGNPDYTPEQQTHAAEKVDEILGKMGKGKGKSPVAKFSDIAKHIIQHGSKKDGQQQGADPGEQQSRGLPPIPQQKDAAPQSGNPDQYAAKSGGQVNDQLKRPSFSSMTVPMTPEQRADRDNTLERKKFETVTKPQLDAAHKNRMEEIQARPSAFTKKSTVTGAELPQDSTDKYGKPVDPSQRYNVMENGRGEQELIPVEDRVASTAEQRVESLAKDIKTQYPDMSDGDAEEAARRLQLAIENKKLDENFAYKTVTTSDGTQVLVAVPSKKHKDAVGEAAGKTGGKNATPSNNGRKKTGLPDLPKPKGDGVARDAHGNMVVDKPKPLSADAKKSIEAIDTGLGLLSETKSMLETQDENGQALYESDSLGGKLETVYQSARYKTGFPPSDERYQKIIQTGKWAQVVLTQAYLHGIRNQEYVKQIQQHLPDPYNDTPKLLYEKLKIIEEAVPKVRDAIMKAESTRVVGGRVIPGQGEAINIPSAPR